MCASESSVSYCDFVTSRGLVGGGPNERDFFEMCQNVVVLRFPEGTMHESGQNCVVG